MLTARTDRAFRRPARLRLRYPSADMPFVTFEGVEGCGKSTQLALAGARLRERRHPVTETREPGGTAVGERIRAVLMDPAQKELDAVTEWLLIEADRRQHVREVLAPAVASGAFVLCDRFSDSTEAYQCAGRGLDAGVVRRVDAIARDGLLPELTLLYDLAPEAGLARARKRDGARTGRFEGADLSFHRAVRAAYLEIARREPERVIVVNSEGDPDSVFTETWKHIAERFSL